MLDLAVATFASWVVPMNLGMIVAARMPMTITTTMISTKGNPPLLSVDVCIFLFLFLEGLAHAENGQQNRNDHEADHGPHHQNQGRREQGNHRFGARPH